MAQPTAAQIKALEKAHKTALRNLLQAIKFRYVIYQKLGGKHPEYDKYAKMIWYLWKSWYNRQLKLEKGGATKENILETDYRTTEGVKKLTSLLKKWDESGKGIGFIPLLIWAVVALAGFFTADQIVDELNNTTEEQTELMKTTGDIADKYGFNKEETKALITEQTDAAESNEESGFPFTKIIIFGGLAFVAYKFFNKPTQKTN